MISWIFILFSDRDHNRCVLCVSSQNKKDPSERTLLHEQDSSGEAAHSADTHVSTSRPSDSKDLHLISTEEEEEQGEDRYKFSSGMWRRIQKLWMLGGILETPGLNSGVVHTLDYDPPHHHHWTDKV